MFKLNVLLSSLVFCSLNVYAGFFGGDDFKCGREDAVKSLQESIRSEAAGLLQSDFITKPGSFYGKNIQDFQSTLNAIGINTSNVSTSGGSGSDLYCNATIAIELPDETMDVIKDIPDYLSKLIIYGGKLNANKIVWNDHSYKIKLADNKKDIAITNGYYVSRSLYQASILAVTKVNIINNFYNAKISEEKYNYNNLDVYLNRVWKNLPDSFRASMKKEQVAWVNEKAVKCGKLSDANSTEIPAQKRIEIYQCQTKMTQDRISFLGGDRDD